MSWHKYYKNEDLQSWIPDSMAEYKNSQNGTLIQKLFYKWNNQDWAPSKLYTYSYNIFGLQTEVLFASWSVNSNTWDTYRKDENTYTDGGILLSEYSYFWNSTLNNWVRRSDILTEYDSLGRITRHVSSNIGASQITQYDYDPSGNFTILLANTLPWLMTFKPSIKFEISINERRQRISEIMFRLIDSVWTLNNKSEYFYNSSGALFQSSHYNWHPENNDWMLSSRSHYYYNAHLTTVKNICLEEIDIFPNPTADIINITGLSHPAEVRLFSIQGQLLKTVHQVESTIDVSDLPTGVYFVNLTTGMESVVRKIVIDR